MSATTPLSIPFPRHSTENHGVVERPPEPPAGALSALMEARDELQRAQRASRAADRFLSAYLAAVRGSTAIITARTHRRAGGRPASVWRLLVAVAPELREWAESFERSAERRARAEAGAPVPERSADALVCRTGEFLEVVGRCLLETPR